MTHISRRSFTKKVGLGIGISTILPSFVTLDHLVPDFESKKLNVALVGLGSYAKILATGLNESKYCRLAGVVTSRLEKAKDWQQTYGFPEENMYTYDSFDEIASNKDIDLVYIVLPNGLHKEYTLRAAKAGKHVIVEKPMAISAKECEEMIQACKNAGVQLSVGYRLHYEPNHLEIKRLGQEKVFGEVRLIEASLGYDITGMSPGHWYFNKNLSGGNALMNLGIYCIQSNRYVLGEEPISVTAQFLPKTKPELFKEVEENISWQLHFPSGAVTNSMATSNCNVDRFYASAEHGFFEMSPALSYGPFKGRSSKGEFNFPVINQQAAQLDGIASHILAGKNVPSHISGEEGLKDLKIIEAIYKSAETGKTVFL